MDLADLGTELRLAAAALALVCCAIYTFCVVVGIPGKRYDIRLRMATILGYCLVTVGGQLQALGRPITWVTWLLLVTVIATLVGGALGLHEARKGSRGPADVDSTVRRAGDAAHGGRGPARDTYAAPGGEQT